MPEENEGQIIGYTKFVAPILDEERREEILPLLIDDIGYRRIKEIDKTIEEIFEEGIPDQRILKLIYNQYLEELVKEGKVSENDVRSAKLSYQTPEEISEEQDDKTNNLNIEIDEKLVPSDFADQIDGFGYEEKSQKWFVLEQCLKGVTIKVLAKRLGEQGWTNKEDTAYGIICRLRQDLKKYYKARLNLEEKTVNLDENGMYLVGKPLPKDKQRKRQSRIFKAEKDPMTRTLQALKDLHEFEFDFDIQEDIIKISVNGSVEFERTDEADKAIGVLILRKQGINAERVI